MASSHSARAAASESASGMFPIGMITDDVAEEVDTTDSASEIYESAAPSSSSLRPGGSVISSSTGTSSSSSSSLSSTSARGLQGVQQKIKEFLSGWCVLSAKSSRFLAWPAFFIQTIQLLSFLFDPYFPWGRGSKAFLQAISFLRTLNVNENYSNLFSLMPCLCFA